MGPAEEGGPKLFRLLYFVGAGFLCTAAINKWRDLERKSALRQQQQQQQNQLSESYLGGETGDSHIDHVEARPGACEMMDECSCMDFSSRSQSMQELLSLLATAFVQETWRKLRHGHIDLQKCISLEEKDASQVLELDYK